MRLIKALQRKRLLALAIAVVCIMVAGAAVWHASKQQASASSDEKCCTEQQKLQERLSRGVGSEVRFASTSAKPGEIDEAVTSAADFIYWRSGLKMSDELKKRLADAESNVLKGSAKRITMEELTETFTTAFMDRLATMTDEEIQKATEVSSDENGIVSTRANGKWGSLTQKELIQQARAGREWSQRGDFALQSSLRSLVGEEVSDRVSKLSTALPAQFGQAGKGITPTQAILIAYSVATDDPLTDSRNDIEQTLKQKRMDAGQTREQRKAQKNVSGRPYGPRGLLHPSAPYLFMNKAAIDSLLNLTEGGKK